jgi:hypothetical protein
MRIRMMVMSLLAALAIQCGAFAQEPEAQDKDAVVIFGRWPSEGACTPENTTAVAFADLLRNKTSYADRCVSTVAWLDFRALFLERDDLNLANSNTTAVAASRRVGLYGPEALMQKVTSTNTTRARVVGKLWDCKDLHGSNVMMVMGYCHYTGGPFIGLSEFHPLS